MSQRRKRVWKYVRWLTEREQEAIYRRNAQLKRDDFYEFQVELALQRMGERYCKQQIIWVEPDRYFIVDFFLPHHQLIIEVDGGSHRKKQRYDRTRTRLIRGTDGRLRVDRMTNQWILDNVTVKSEKIIQKISEWIVSQRMYLDRERWEPEER